MEIEIFAVCEYSKILEKKLNIFGVFETINIPELPLIYPLFYIAGRIGFEISEIGKCKYTIKIDIENPAGEKLVEPFIEVINDGSITATEHAYNFSKCFTNVLLNKYGRRSVTLSLNNKPLKTIPLFISPDLRELKK